MEHATVCVPQASEDRVHFIVSRQTHIPTPDILQEAPWNMEGPPPYSPVDIEQALLVSLSTSERYSQWEKMV